MNVPFVTGNEELDAKFVKEAKEAGFENLKGHRSVGGMRASIYNAMPIEGVEKFSGARISAPDLRAGAALCIAGLATDGVTIIDDIEYIQRGYEKFEEKLRSLGGVIERTASEKEIQKFILKVG